MKMIAYMFSVAILVCVGFISYQWVARPELTEMQLLLEYWPQCVAGGVCALLMNLFLAFDKREKRAIEQFERNMRK